MRTFDVDQIRLNATYKYHFGRCARQARDDEVRCIIFATFESEVTKARKQLKRVEDSEALFHQWLDLAADLVSDIIVREDPKEGTSVDGWLEWVSFVADAAKARRLM